MGAYPSTTRRRLNRLADVPLDHGAKLRQLAAQEDGRQLRRKRPGLARSPEGGDDRPDGRCTRDRPLFRCGPWGVPLK